MKIPQLDLKAQLPSLREELIRAITDVIDSTQYIMGPSIAELEQAVARYTGVKHGIGVSSGTDALLLSLMALDIGPDDIVITTPYSFFATAGAAARLQARLMFADIDPRTYNLDPGRTIDLIEGLSEKERAQVKAIIPVHLYGQAADIVPLLEVTALSGIPIIEDCAQAIGARYSRDGDVVRAGSLGLACCYSFFPSKNLGGIGDAGMVVTDDDDFADKLRIMRVHGARPKYYHHLIGGNFRLDTIQAAALLVKLPFLDRWHRERQEAAAYYDQHLNGIPGLTCPQLTYPREWHIYNQYIINVPDRDGLKSYLAKRDVSTAIYYPVPLHLQPCFDYLNYRKGDFPVAEEAAERTLALPIYPEISHEQQDYIIGAIRAYSNA